MYKDGIYTGKPIDLSRVVFPNVKGKGVMSDSNETRFKVATQATVTLDMEIEVGANDSFADARELAKGAVENWINEMFREYAPQKWPSPKKRAATVRINAVEGRWTREPKTKGKDEDE